jgi:uncharacterized protein
MTNSLAEALIRAEAAFRAKNYPEAFNEYARLAEAGHVESQVMTGWMLLQGYGIRRDETAAENWFAKAASLGSPTGNFYHARYLSRLGRHEEALRHYRASSRANYLPAVFWLGYSASRGFGMSVDIELAYQHLWRAARKGHMHALREAAMLDMKGYRGTWARPLGMLEFAAAVIGGFIVAAVNRDSDLLRA